MALDNTTCHRAAAIRAFMAGPNGLLRRYRPSTHLIERGLLEEIEPPRQGRNPGRYRLLGETSDCGHNNLTPPPPTHPAGRAWG